MGELIINHISNPVRLDAHHELDWLRVMKDSGLSLSELTLAKRDV